MINRTSLYMSCIKNICDISVERAQKKRNRLRPGFEHGPLGFQGSLRVRDSQTGSYILRSTSLHHLWLYLIITGFRSVITLRSIPEGSSLEVLLGATSLLAINDSSSSHSGCPQTSCDIRQSN
jgi:hypothetical protein